jgi:hypothetical protein
MALPPETPTASPLEFPRIPANYVLRNTSQFSRFRERRNSKICRDKLLRTIFVRDCVSPENCGFTTSSGLRNSLTFSGVSSYSFRCASGVLHTSQSG